MLWLYTYFLHPSIPSHSYSQPESVWPERWPLGTFAVPPPPVDRVALVMASVLVLFGIAARSNSTCAD